MMRAPSIITEFRTPVTPDSLLVWRIAALADILALAELEQRYGMTLYAIAYSLVFDPAAADQAVAHTFREVWRSAAALFRAGETTVQRWLISLTRRAARAHGAPQPKITPRAASRA